MSLPYSLLCNMNISLADGTLAQSTAEDNKPTKLTLGDESLSPAFEAQIKPLKAGDKHSFSLAAKDTFGEKNPAAIHQMPKSKFPADLTLEVGVIISFAGPGGSEIPGTITQIEGDQVSVDLNHPLAGQQLKFDIEVLEVL